MHEVFNPHHTDIVVVKSAVKKQGIIFGFIIERCSEIGPFVPDVFTGNRRVGQYSQFQNLPRFFPIHDGGDIARLRRTGVASVRAGTDSNENIPVGLNDGRSNGITLFAPEIGSGWYDRLGISQNPIGQGV